MPCSGRRQGDDLSRLNITATGTDGGLQPNCPSKRFPPFGDILGRNRNGRFTSTPLAAVFQRKQREGQNRGSHLLQTESNRSARDTTCVFFTRVPNAALSLVTTPPSAVQAFRC